jgi:hypothetical protein
MILKQVMYDRLFKTGEFQNVRLGCVIELESMDTREAAYDEAKRIVEERFEKEFNHKKEEPKIIGPIREVK